MPLVRYRYLAVVPHILVTVRHITDVLININGRASVCCRTHLVSPRDLIVGGSGSGAVWGNNFCEALGEGGEGEKTKFSRHHSWTLF